MRKGVAADGVSAVGCAVRRVTHIGSRGGMVSGNLQLREGKTPSFIFVGDKTLCALQPDVVAVITHLHTRRGSPGARPGVFHIPFTILKPFRAIGTDLHIEACGIVEV